jgi:hypothetical protein
MRRFAYRALTSYGGPFQTTSTHNTHNTGYAPQQPLNPESIYPRFGLLPFRSPLLRESLLISLPLGTEMFQFPRLASSTYLFSQG